MAESPRARFRSWPPRAWLLVAMSTASLGSLSACAANQTGGGSSTAQLCAKRETFIVSRITLTPETGDRVAEGFNLDGEVTTTNNAEACQKQDFTSPDGVPGIDNAFSRLVPLLRPQGVPESDTLEGFLRESIKLGLLRLGVETTVDSAASDTCSLNMVALYAPEAPAVDAAGILLPGQTFQLPPNATPDDARVGFGQAQKAETVEAGPAAFFGLQLPYAQDADGNVLVARFILRNARLRLTAVRGERIEGLIGGLTPVTTTSDGQEGLVQIAAKIVGDLSQPPFNFQDPTQSLSNFADVRNPGATICDEMSVAFAFEAIPATF